jgi:hypothetical protein
MKQKALRILPVEDNACDARLLRDASKERPAAFFAKKLPHPEKMRQCC